MGCMPPPVGYYLFRNTLRHPRTYFYCNIKLVFLLFAVFRQHCMCAGSFRNAGQLIKIVRFHSFEKVQKKEKSSERLAQI